MSEKERIIIGLNDLLAGYDFVITYMPSGKNNRVAEVDFRIRNEGGVDTLADAQTKCRLLAQQSAAACIAFTKLPPGAFGDDRAI